MSARAAAMLRAAAPDFTPRLALVLGSGFGALADRIEPRVALDYRDIPDFPAPGVPGHRGRLTIGMLGALPVACLEGRVHVYEGQGAAPMAAPIRSLKAIGAEMLIITSAAGSLLPSLSPGRLMLVSDHINLLPLNPLTGPNDERVGPRFPSLAGAYDAELRSRLAVAARKLGIDLAAGTYLATSGPNFETPAEIRAFRLLGADAVGMSLVPEVILARHCGLRVAAIAAITNLGEGMGGPPPSHAHTLAVAADAARDLERLLLAFAEGF